MTSAPADLLEVRDYLLRHLDLQPGVARGADLDPGEVGIVGDPAHAASGGYHEGNVDLRRVGRIDSDYSKRESPRDRPGTDDAAALDIGDFDATLPGGRRVTLRTLSATLVAACVRGDPRTRDIREVIWSPDGVTVLRWDRLKIRNTGDSSHRWHTHLSFHRDSAARRARRDNVLGLLAEIIEGDGMSITPEELTAALAGCSIPGTDVGGFGRSRSGPEYFHDQEQLREMLLGELPLPAGSPLAKLLAAVAQPAPVTVTLTADQLAALSRDMSGYLTGVLERLDHLLSTIAAAGTTLAAANDPALRPGPAGG